MEYLEAKRTLWGSFFKHVSIENKLELIEYVAFGIKPTSSWLVYLLAGNLALSIKYAPNLLTAGEIQEVDYFINTYLDDSCSGSYDAVSEYCEKIRSLSVLNNTTAKTID